MKPAPPPNTLRMGDQRFGPDHMEEIDPLRIYRRIQGKSEESDTTQPAADTDRGSEGAQ